VPKVSQEHLDARRSQILEGARRAFAQHGYEGATVARLEEATGLSRGAIFHYFENKQDLFIELAMDTNRRLGDVLLAQGLDAAVRQIANESPDWLGVLLEAEGKLRHDPAFVRRFEAKAESAGGRILAWFEERQTAGDLRDDVPAAELARFATMVMNGLALRVAGQDPFDVESTLQLLRDAVVAR
jgi:TetR/AcrR family transcriptional regulator, transcriptional repressor of aconitase